VFLCIPFLLEFLTLTSPSQPRQPVRANFEGSGELEELWSCCRGEVKEAYEVCSFIHFFLSISYNTLLGQRLKVHSSKEVIAKLHVTGGVLKRMHVVMDIGESSNEE
jgi:hypothetical protein